MDKNMVEHVHSTRRMGKNMVKHVYFIRRMGKNTVKHVHSMRRMAQSTGKHVHSIRRMAQTYLFYRRLRVLKHTDRTLEGRPRTGFGRRSPERAQSEPFWAVFEGRKMRPTFSEISLSSSASPALPHPPAPRERPDLPILRILRLFYRDGRHRTR